MSNKEFFMKDQEKSKSADHLYPASCKQAARRCQVCCSREYRMTLTFKIDSLLTLQKDSLRAEDTYISMSPAFSPSVIRFSVNNGSGTLGFYEHFSCGF